MTGISPPKPASKGNTSAFWRFISTGGGGLLIVVLLFVAIMSVVSKQFLSTFNIFVLTREVSTAVLIGFSQMIVLAIGQMNLSVGAIGGLVVVVTGGLMEVYQWPIWAAVVAGLSVGILCGYPERLHHHAHRAERLHRDDRDGQYFPRPEPWHDPSAALLQDPRRL